MDVKYWTIDLREKVAGGVGIKFLSVEYPYNYRIPAAIVWYEDGGRKQEVGLSLDIDKRVFLSHLSDKDKEAILERAAPKIVAVIQEEEHRHSLEDRVR